MTSIEPTRPQDLDELSRFLAEGFGESTGAKQFNAEVLDWKYFQNCGVESGPRSLVVRSGGKIVAHAGIIPRHFLMPSGAAASPDVSTLHLADLLATPNHPGSCFRAVRHTLAMADTQYGLGGSDDGQRLVTRIGYVKRTSVARMWGLLRPGYRFHRSDLSLVARSLRVGWDVWRYLTHPGRRPPCRVELERVDAFGSEPEQACAMQRTPILHTDRSAGVLNYYLRHPSRTMSGWTIFHERQLIGFAILNVQQREDNARRGKIVECYLASDEIDLWHAAIVALVLELKRQQADDVTCYASRPVLRVACERAGLMPRGADLPLRLWDPRSLLPANVPFHMTMLEADHGYV